MHAGSIAAKALKASKYSDLASSGDYVFFAVVIETMGVWGESALALCDEIGKRAAYLSRDPRALTFLKQRMGLAVQRGNAATVAGIHPQGDISLSLA